MLVFLISILFLSNSHASDCSSFNLKSNEEVRLDKQGSLSNFKVQDQDGLGTCYANTASVLLHSVSNETPSYLMLARNFGKGKNEGNQDLEWNESTKSYDLTLNGGEVCKVIKNAKENQKKGNYICKQDSIRMEKLASESSDPLNKQAYFLKSFLEWNSFIEKEENNKSIGKQLQSTDGFLAKLRENAVKSCSPTSVNFIARKLYDLFSEIFTACFQNSALKLNSICESTSYRWSMIFQDQMTTKSMGDGWYIPLPQEKINLKDEVKIKIQALNSTLNRNELNNFIVELISNDPFLKADLKMKKTLSDWNQVSPLISKYSDFVKLFQQSGASSEECIQYEILDQLSLKHPLESECKNQTIFYSMNLLGQSYDKNFDKIMKYLLEQNKESLFQEIGLDCDKKDRIVIPETIDCEEADFTEKDINGKNKYSTNEDILEIKKKNTPQIINSLKNNLAVGYSFCTEVFYKPAKYLTTENRENKMCNRAHGHHATAIIGVKCEDDQLKFLVQNSWGKNWSPKNENLKSVENGKFWMSSDDLFYNAEALTYILKK
ncbi:MAG: hypothetical protein HOP07_05800 [Bacteriovoracaceae bacterium]|nr:hypothetical protein [Bacteriovoracaceae bacterium]